MSSDCGMTEYDLKLLDLMAHPERHHHETLFDIRDCCTIDGNVDLQLFDQHSQYANMGTNGGVQCDVRRGPCSCGAWH